MPYLLKENNAILGHFKLGEDGIVGGNGEWNLINGFRSPLKGLGTFGRGILQHRCTVNTMHSKNTL